MLIVIPTCKKSEEIEPLIREIRQFTPEQIEIFASCCDNSAAYNRNVCLARVKFGELVIMMDDDITGFFPSWYEKLIMPFSYISDVLVSSARLIKRNGKFAHNSSDDYTDNKDFVVVETKRVPTACIAFVNHGVTFDESFIGSGFEDDDFCRQLTYLFPNGKFVINNLVKLIHLNNMTNQKGVFWEHNKTYYLSKWGRQEENRWR